MQIAPNLGIDTNDVGYRVRVDAAGKVYASGTTGSGIDFRIARLSADLSATEYATTTDFNGQSDFAQDLAVDSAGFVTAVGTAGGTLNTIAAARYTATGASTRVSAPAANTTRSSPVAAAIHPMRSLCRLMAASS